MLETDFEYFCRITKERSGLILGPDKKYLIEGRLHPIAVAEGIATVEALLAMLHGSGSEMLIRRCVDAMATHETSFFRDRTPFDQLIETVVPHILETNGKRRSLRIWSAACSTGQEPYSIAMTLLHRAPALADWHIEILATDLTEEPLSKARSGRYTAFEIKRGLSESEIAKNFHRVNDDTWEILPKLKTWVHFRPHNLLASYAGMGPFDLVYCRNVLIYFNRQTKGEVLEKIASVLTQNGLLMLGSAETVVGLSHSFSVVKGARGIYQRAKTPVLIPALT